MFRRIFKIAAGLFHRCRAGGPEKIDVVKMSTKIKETVAQETSCGRRFKELLGRLRKMDRIQKDRPLPSHTKLDYDECYAKIVLEKFFPEKYIDLKIADKPDLRDESNNIGIEVTSAIPQNDQEAASLACEIPYLGEIKKNKRISYLKTKGYDYTDYGMFGTSRSFAWTGIGYPDIDKTHCKYFLSAVKNKIRKLNNSGYAQMGRYDLFVNSELFIENWMPDIKNLGFVQSGAKALYFYLLTCIKRVVHL